MSPLRRTGALYAKRTLLLAALSLIIVPAFSPLASAQTPVRISRALPLQLTSSTTPKRDTTKPFTFITTGRLTYTKKLCAAGAGPGPGQQSCLPLLCSPGATSAEYCFTTAALACTGVVTVRYQKPRLDATVSARNARLKPDCTYRSTVSFRLNLPTRRGNLRVRARFQGNAILLARTSSTKLVSAG